MTSALLVSLPLRRCFVATLVLGLAGGPMRAQERQRASSNAPFRKAPGSLRLGTLVAGTEYPVGRIDRTWILATVEGWIPAGSAAPSTREGFNLIVTAGAGEAVHATPGGAVVARVQAGTLLSRVETRGTWIKIRRQGWVARADLAGPGAESKPVAPAPAPAAAAPPRPSTTQAPAPVAVPPPADSTAPTGPKTDEGRVTLRRGARLALVPDGDAMADLARPTTGAIVERTRDWVKVRVEGWVRSADIAGLAEPGPKVTAAMIRAEPDRYLGHDVAWRLQFLAIQEADELRPEIPRGQLYLLTRGPLPESGFVYVMVTKAQADQYRRLQPLDEIRVDGVLKAARTKYLPTPVVELK